jgi:hypothetical protein
VFVASPQAASHLPQVLGVQSTEVRLGSPEIGSLKHCKDNIYQHKFIRPLIGSLYLRLIDDPILRFEFDG